MQRRHQLDVGYILVAMRLALLFEVRFGPRSRKAQVLKDKPDKSGRERILGVHVKKSGWMNPLILPASWRRPGQPG